jgi:hypothetical protein
MPTAPIPPASTATSAPTAADRASTTWRTYLPATAAVTYVAAWVAGLAAWPVNLALNASATQVTAAFRQHPTEAVIQLLLVEGLAGLLLGVVLAAVLLGCFPRIARPLVPVACGAAAVTVSVAQCVIGLMATAAATSHDTTRCGDLAALLNRLDGVKMLALAVVAIWLAAAPVGPRWLRPICVLLAVTIAVSGYAYVALANVLGWTAYISGLALLAWVAALGIWVTVSRRHFGGNEVSSSGRRP